MNITVVDNLLFEQQPGSGLPKFDLHPHLGLLSLMAAADAGGHHCRLVDPKLEVHRGHLPMDGTLYRKLAQTVLETVPDVVGLTSLGCNFVCTLKVAKYVKEMAPELPIFLGGPHATILCKEILHRFDCFDVIVRGEGERSFPLALNALGTTALRDVDGIAYRSEGEIVLTGEGHIIEDLDELPSADYSHYPIDELGLQTLRVEAGRGCPFHCTFCSTADFFGRLYRLKSPQKLRDEMLELRSRYRINDFTLQHDLFTVNKKKIYAFCDAIRDDGFTWSCSARVDCVDTHLLTEMVRAGCRSIYYGIETGSKKMQEITKKRLNLDLVEPVLETTLSLGVSAVASFITGYPEETHEDQNETLRRLGRCVALAAEAKDLLMVQLHLLTPEPGTELLRQYSGRLLYDGHITDFNFPTLEPDDDRVMCETPEIFVNHHFFTTVLPRERHIFVTEISHLLFSLGFPIVAHIMGRHSGNLSRFMDNIYDWSKASNKIGERPDVILERYLDDTFGPNDYLPSLANYVVTAHRLNAVISSV